jgi:hypothetical protein
MRVLILITEIEQGGIFSCELPRCKRDANFNGTPKLGTRLDREIARARGGWPPHLSPEYCTRF